MYNPENEGAIKKKTIKLIQKAIDVGDNQCQFMDATSETKRFTYETDLVLDYDDFNLQTILDYIRITGFEIDQFMFDKFWQSMVEGSCVLCDAAVLEWLGYDHEQDRDRKAAFLRLLKSNAIEFRQIKHTDPDFSRYPEFVEEAKTMSSAALKSQKWVILDTQDFKRVLFSLRTKRARDIHDYYLSLERLMSMYAEYTHHFELRRERRRAATEKKSLLELMEGLKINHKKECDAAQQERDAAQRAREESEQKFRTLLARGDELLHHAEQAEDDRMVMMHDIRVVRNVAAPEPNNPDNYHRMAIVKMSPDYVWDEDDKRYLRNVDAIAVRIQARDYNARIRQIKRYGRGTNEKATVLISFDSPNSVRLYNKLKEEHGDKFTFVPPVGICFNPSTEHDLIEAVRDMHEARMNYPK